MKSGSQSDPFGEADTADSLFGDESDETTTETESEAETQTDPEPANETGGGGSSGSIPVGGSGEMPYAIERDSVKDGRNQHPIYFRPETVEEQAKGREEVASIVGYEPYLLDFKEAVFLAGLRHPETVADILNEDGCEYA